MDKKTKNILTGVGGVAGAGLGVGAAAMFTQSANADTNEEVDLQALEEIPEEEEIVVEAAPEMEQPRAVIEDAEVVVPEDNIDVQNSEGEIVIDGPEIEVLGYETVQLEDGSTVDVAMIENDGTAIAFIDATQNGVADVMAVDANHNQMFDDGEYMDVHDQNISMQQFEDVAKMNEDLADLNNGPDYTNDANVEDYVC